MIPPRGRSLSSRYFMADATCGQSLRPRPNHSARQALRGAQRATQQSLRRAGLKLRSLSVPLARLGGTFGNAPPAFVKFAQLLHGGGIAAVGAFPVPVHGLHIVLADAE